MEYAIVTAPAAPVRRKPAHRKEMVNQLLFGETVEVLKASGDLWVKVRSLHDSYEGWTTRTLLTSTDADLANRKQDYVTTALLHSITVGEKTLHIPFGSTLPSFSNGGGLAGGATYLFDGPVSNRFDADFSIELLNRYIEPWMNAPYMWGGRSPLGVDCSGFVQIIFKMVGIDLPRDAWQQAQFGEPVKFRNHQPGDLAFFDNREEIVHVGIFTAKGEMTHASGKVRVDMVDKKGLINTETAKRTLRLRAIRRVHT
jgi:cell wall-associated NlpC family hydrolase